MSKVVIILGHPRPGSFSEALAEAYKRGADEGGHTAELLALAPMRFDPILREAYVKPQPLEPDLEAAHRAIMAADHLVIVFPLYLGDMPAILKGFLERLLQPDLVGPAKEGKFVKLLKGKSARIIVTMGMPGFVYRWWFGAYAVKIVKHNILGFMGVSPVRATVLGRIEQVGDDQRKSWLASMEALGRRAG